MTITFDSRALERQIGLADLPQLSEVQLRELSCELTMAVQVMDERIQEAYDTERLSGLPKDQDWINRVKKKRRICATLAGQVNQAIQRSESVDRLYLLHLERLVAEELGERVWSEIKQEALAASIQALSSPQPAAPNA
jgi:hypothetical protein